MPKLIALFENVWNLLHQLHACYKAVEGSKEKDSAKGRISRLDAFCIKGDFLKGLQYTQEDTWSGVSF